MKKKPNVAVTDDDEGAPTGDQWVIAHYHAYHGISLHFVTQKDGKPRADYGTTPETYHAAKWKSYHAARKWLKSHPDFVGYEILNLSHMQRLCAAWRKAEGYA